MSRSCTPMATLALLRPTVVCSFSCSSMSERMALSSRVTLRMTAPTTYGRTPFTEGSTLMTMSEDAMS